MRDCRNAHQGVRPDTTSTSLAKQPQRMADSACHQSLEADLGQRRLRSLRVPVLELLDAAA